MKKNNIVWLLTIIFTVGILTVDLQAAELRLSVAASMTDVFKELIAAYSKNHPDVKILPNFGSSGGLAKQINLGAPADLYVSANPKWMKYLIDTGKIKPDSEKTFAYNSLVFIGMKDNKISSLEKLPMLERIAIGSPRSVPAGQYAQQAMENSGVYKQLLNAGKLVMAKDVRQALIYADRGEVDGAFVYKTDALLAREAIILFEVPQGLHDRITCPMALTVSGAEKKDAQEFFAYISSAPAEEIIKKYAFILPE